MTEAQRRFPAALVAARQSEGLTQDQLAARVQRSQQAVAKWESGESYPSRRSMVALLEALPTLEELVEPTIKPRQLFVPENMPTYRIESPGAVLEREIESRLPTLLHQYFKKHPNNADYESEKAVVEIVMLPADAAPRNVIAALWRLSTTRKRNNDNREYYLIAVRSPSAGARTGHRQQIYLSRYTADAFLHGIVLLVAEDAEHAASIIESIERGDTSDLYTTFDNEHYEP